MQVNLTASPPARLLAEICADARRATCGHCWQFPHLGCVTHPETGRGGYHVARFASAHRRGLISDADLLAALAVADAFTNDTVIYADGAR